MLVPEGLCRSAFCLQNILHDDPIGLQVAAWSWLAPHRLCRILASHDARHQQQPQVLAYFSRAGCGIILAILLIMHEIDEH